MCLSLPAGKFYTILQSGKMKKRVLKMPLSQWDPRCFNNHRAWTERVEFTAMICNPSKSSCSICRLLFNGINAIPHKDRKKEIAKLFLEKLTSDTHISLAAKCLLFNINFMVQWHPDKLLFPLVVYQVKEKLHTKGF